MSNKAQPDKAADVAKTEAPALADWQQRVVIEKDEVDAKALKLREFIGSKEFDALDATNQNLLRRQGQVLNAYALVLGQRIALF
jgi:hypothetical protein